MARGSRGKSGVDNEVSAEGCVVDPESGRGRPRLPSGLYLLFGQRSSARSLITSDPKCFREEIVCGLRSDLINPTIGEVTTIKSTNWPKRKVLATELIVTIPPEGQRRDTEVDKQHSKKVMKWPEAAVANEIPRRRLAISCLCKRCLDRSIRNDRSLNHFRTRLQTPLTVSN